MPYDFSVKVKDCPVGIPHAAMEMSLSPNALNAIRVIIQNAIPEDAWAYSFRLVIEAQIPLPTEVQIGPKKKGKELFDETAGGGK